MSKRQRFRSGRRDGFYVERNTPSSPRGPRRIRVTFGRYSRFSDDQRWVIQQQAEGADDAQVLGTWFLARSPFDSEADARAHAAGMVESGLYILDGADGRGKAD